MPKAKHSDGWSLNEGLAAKYAADAGLDPELGAQAGEAAWDVLKSFSDAVHERNPKRRAGLVARTRARLAKAGLSRHRELVRGIQQGLAELEGKGKPRASKASVNPNTKLQEFMSPPVSKPTEIMPPYLPSNTSGGFGLLSQHAVPQNYQATALSSQGPGQYPALQREGNSAFLPLPSEPPLPPSASAVASAPGHVANPYGDAARGAIVNSPDSGEYMTAYFDNLFADGSIQDQIADAGDLFYDPHYGEPDKAPPKIPLGDLPKDFSIFSDEDLIDRIRKLSGAIAIEPIKNPTRRPFGGPLSKIRSVAEMFRLKQIRDAHLTECAARPTCNFQSAADMIRDRD